MNDQRVLRRVAPARNRIAPGAIVLLLLSMLAFPGSALVPSTAHATTNDLRVRVVDADDHSIVIGNFTYIINVDNTGTTNQHTPTGACSPDTAGYPESCEWTSMGVPGSAPIYTQGDQNDFPLASMPAGSYLISVLADGYKLDGAHFSVPLPGDGTVTVQMQSTVPGVPDAQIQAAVFEDNALTNSAPDLPAEHGLAGFHAGIKDYLGDVTTDVYGSPLCTIYDAAGTAQVGTGGDCQSWCYVVDSGVDIGIVRPTGAQASQNIGPCPTIDPDLGPGVPTGLRMWALPTDGRYAHPPSGASYTTPVPSSAAIEGKVQVPHLGTNRFTMTVTPPNGTNWVQTTTLEGNHDWDAWIMEGATGLDTEFTAAGEPFPGIIFGYVNPTANPAAGVSSGATGSITGVVDYVKYYYPPANGVTGFPGSIFGGLNGGKIDSPIAYPWLSLNDLDAGDRAIWVGQGAADGSFTIGNVPDGTYTLTWWDEAQDMILDLEQVTIVNGEQVDMGILPLTGWWTQYDGFVFNDTNRNGKMDWQDADGDGCPDPGEGELGVPNYTLTMRKRENSLMDRGTTSASTDACGRYYFESGYPMTQWLVMEAYNDLYYTTGVTYQADNQPQPTTVVGAGVDVSTLPIIGLTGRMDWGVHSYDATGANGVDPRNGGIVGTVSYDTTRNELDPRYAAVEDWQPGVSGLTVDLYQPVDCPIDATTGLPTDPTTLALVPCDAGQRYLLASDGSYAFGTKINAYVTETWSQPGANDNANGDGDCIPRDVDGNELTYPAKQQVTSSHADCLEAPLMGVQFQQGFSTVDGNYGFGDGCFAPNVLDATDPSAPTCSDPNGNAVDFTPLAGGADYLVHVEMAPDAVGKPQYEFTREEDINIANGDSIVPQLPPPACVGALHTVDLAGAGTDGYEPTYFKVDPATGEVTPQTAAVDGALPNAETVITVPASDSTANATFLDIGGSPYESQQRPVCDTKLVPLANGRSIVPTFNVFTDVPLPGRFWGLVVDDLNFSTNPHQINYGEKAGVPFAPVGIYDYTNRLVYTAHSDYSGLFDVLMPSTNRINCPTPSGVCANLYRFVGNDPGAPGALNPDWKPEYRTIAAEFEAIPGLLVPADLAPTQVGVVVQLPGGQASPVECPAEATRPQLFAVDHPYVIGANGGSFTINGTGFGAQGASSAVLLDGTAIPTTSWNDQQIAATVPAGFPYGPHQLTIRSASGLSTIDGLTFHVMDGSDLAPYTGTPPLATFTTGSATSLGTGFSDDAPDTGIFASDVNNSNVARVRTGAATYHAWWTASTAGADDPTGPGGQILYGPDQQAWFTFVQRSAAATEQGLLLKFSAATPGALDSHWIEVAIANAAGDVVVRTKAAGSATVTTEATLPGAFGTGVGQLGARALSDGTILVYRGTTLIGDVLVPDTGSWNGGIGVRFTGTGTTATTEDRFDDFGGGNIGNTQGVYSPNLFEVGAQSDPNYTAAKAQRGRWFTPTNSLGNATPTADHAIQNAIDAARNTPGPDLVVVYPGVPTPSNSRLNPKGVYFENLIMSAPVKLQGVGAGGFQGSTYVPGSIIDGSAFGGDTPVAADWLTNIAGLTWSGNQTINDGAIISVYAQETGPTAFGGTFTAAIDGFGLQGGDQQGFPTNLNQVGGLPTGLPASVTTQGGAVFANAFARHLGITNNVIQNNGGGYGTVRIGTPDIGTNHNESVRIANNRIVANGGTNLAGAIGVFAGADGYEISGNDLCGNFSAEYGGGITAYGLSPNGSIHHNRLWFNRSYDEGGGIMIAGQLPVDPAALSSGSGPVRIYSNLIQANLSNDDGGGIRLLMVGNHQIDIDDNIIVNNVSTHEGGGVALDDASNVRFYNNTVMKNLTTATALTSNGTPAPAGLSTARNSVQLQATLPPGSPVFSRPLLFNNIFMDNRAGSQGAATVVGLGLPGDPTPVNVWDLGVADGSGQLSPTTSILSSTVGTISSPTNTINTSPAAVVADPYDTVVSFDAWRTNPSFIGAILVTLDVPPTLLGDYHLAGGSPAVDRGATAAGGVNAPKLDIDDQSRGCVVDIGADEAPTTPCITADVTVSKTDGVTSVNVGARTTYTIVVSKTSADALTGVAVQDLVPAGLTGASWTCTATAGSACTAANGTGSISTSVSLAAGAGASATFVLTGIVAGSGTLTNTVTVTAPPGVTDTNPQNNAATDRDTIVVPPPPGPTPPVVTILDDFNRPNANVLGANWSQFVIGGRAAIRVATNQARSSTTGSAYWVTAFGARQYAAITFVNSTTRGDALMLKASGGTAIAPLRFIRVQVVAGNVVVSTTTNGGISFVTRGRFPATFTSGNTLIAEALQDGTVAVFRQVGAATPTLVGSVVIPTAGTGAWAQPAGTSRIGIRLVEGSRVDNFGGGIVP